MKRSPTLWLVVLLSLVVLPAAKRRAVRSPGGEPPPLSLERSFAITDKAILDAFRFERVLDSLVARSDANGMTAEKLFRQWFDTQNPKPGLDASMPHCNDEMTDGKASLNGFAIACPADGGFFATAPFLPDEIIPIGITNRFDFADGAQCGQYRIAFAQKRSMPQETFHIIFEAELPNPKPETGLAGCKPVAQFWANLSGMASLSERRAELERFFFEGIDGFAPVFDPDHYHRAAAGIRTLQFTAPKSLAHFLQYRLIEDCTGGTCKLFMKPDVLENMPPGSMFDASIESSRAAAFRAAFVQNVKKLATRDTNLYHMAIGSEFLMPDSQPGEGALPFLYDGPFGNGKKVAAGVAFRDAIAAELASAGSTLTPEIIITRAETQTCVGCHFSTSSAPVGEGVVFPAAMRDLQHVTEDTLENGEGGPQSRFAISPAMRNSFIPHRMQILRDYLATGKAPVHSN